MFLISIACFDFRTIQSNHIVVCEDRAEDVIPLAVRKAELQYLRESRERTKFMHSNDWRTHRINNVKPSAEGYIPFDTALNALYMIVSSKSKSNSGNRPKGVQRRGISSKVERGVLRRADTLPNYDTWVPVITNYWSGKQLHLEPYMPFLGDQDVDCELAFEVFEDMADDSGKALDLSDGEVNKEGELILPREDVQRIKYYSLPQVRLREVTRTALRTVLRQFDKYDEQMWQILAASLGIHDITRLKAVARVAKDRYAETEQRSRRRKRQLKMEQSLQNARKYPVDEEMPLDDEWSAVSNTIKHFCFTCHSFSCPQHAKADVEPILPIEDIPALEREAALKRNQTTPCDKGCFMRKDPNSVTRRPWDAEEILVLRESVPMFGIDPCSLALVVGSRTCHEVFDKLHDPLEADIAQTEIEKARKPRKIDDAETKQKDPVSKDQKVVCNKTVADTTEEYSIDQDFVPCIHDGPCTKENCMCVKKGMYCESTCGCNFGRYGEGGATGGIVWQPPSLEAVRKGQVRECLNRHYGCLCEAGHCCDSQCPCWEHNRACNPDFCACDCSVLPKHITRSQRRCRNIPVTLALHKRTYIGKSDVHGYGLFAGETFEPGDLVGAYSGQLIDTRLADMIGRLYDATDRTYIFNVTESLVIDGGLLGSKAKFCNHTKPGSTENCASRLVRVRGDAYVALFCKQKVRPGEEFLFDYRFTGEVPNWAKDEKNKGPRK